MTVTRDQLPDEITNREKQGGRYKSPLGDQRERPVPCRSRRVNECERTTFALDAICDFCAFGEMLARIGGGTDAS
jgi:hypothetical protein